MKSSAPRNILRSGVCLLAMLLFSGCDNGNNGDGEVVECTPGDIQQCYCGPGVPNNIQTCLPSGTQWTTCDCPTSDTWDPRSTDSTDTDPFHTMATDSDFTDTHTSHSGSTGTDAVSRDTSHEVTEGRSTDVGTDNIDISTDSDADTDTDNDEAVGTDNIDISTDSNTDSDTDNGDETTWLTIAPIPCCECECAIQDAATGSTRTVTENVSDENTVADCPAACTTVCVEGLGWSVSNSASTECIIPVGTLDGSFVDEQDITFDTVRVRRYIQELAIEYVAGDTVIFRVRLTLPTDDRLLEANVAYSVDSIDYPYLFSTEFEPESGAITFNNYTDTNGELISGHFKIILEESADDDYVIDGTFGAALENPQL